MSYLLTILATIFAVVYAYGAYWAFKFTKAQMPDATIKERALAIAFWPKTWGAQVFRNLI